MPEKVGTYTTRVLPWHGEPVHLNPKVLDGFNQTQDAHRTPLRKLLDGCSPERARLDALLVFLELNANIRLDTHGGVNGNLLNREWEEGSPVRGTATPTHRVGDLYFTWHQCPNRHDREDDQLHIAPSLLERVCGSSNPETRQRFVDALRFLRREGLVHERIAVFNQPPEEHERARMQYIALFASSKESAQINRNNGQAAIAHLALNALRRADCEADEVLEECIEQWHDGRPFDAPSTRKPFVAVLCGQRALVRTIFIPDPIAHTADNCSGQEYMNRLNDSWATKLENFARETSDVSA
ncbi:hypothetical protein [Algiphilus sp.]|uniref:hypothetical protein n=1 Tax=Algiphilus sp. TaxID=1872431 RepID=UPI0032ED33C9